MGGVVKPDTFYYKNGKTYAAFVLKTEAKSKDYYIAAFMNGDPDDDFINEYPAFFNSDTTVIGKLKAGKKGWQSGKLKLINSDEFKKVKLKGKNDTITFIAKAPFTPEIDFIKLVEKQDDEGFDMNEFEDYMKKLKERDIKQMEEMVEKGESTLKSFDIDPYPENYFDLEENVSISYTFYRRIYISRYDPITIETDGGYASYFDPVLHVFLDGYSYVVGNSYTDDNSAGGYDAELTIELDAYDIPGFYIVMVRNKPNRPSGYLDVKINGTTYEDQRICSGFVQASGDYFSNYTYLNHFTANTTTDSYIWVHSGNENTGKIISSNDDYYHSSSDFDWGRSSRVRQSYANSSYGNAIVTTYSLAQSGAADAYMNCRQGDVNTTLFPNLKTIDAIRSGDNDREPAYEDWAYNCAGYGGGFPNPERITYGYFHWGWWYWPPIESWAPWYNSNALTAFDNFYGNNFPNPDTCSICNGKRYSDAMSFGNRKTSMGTNSCVALWYNSNIYPSGSYTHISVRKPANNQSHGYDWESKPGHFNRFFHPRDALENNNYNKYGSIKYYYDYIPEQKSQSIYQTIQNGKTIFVYDVFKATEKGELQFAINRLPLELINEFDFLYASWKETWSQPEIAIHSNPRMYAISDEYDQLIEFCKEKGEKTWLLVIDKLEKGDFFMLNALIDLTFYEYSFIMDNIREQNIKNLCADNGDLIIPTAPSGWITFSKELLKYYNGDEFVSRDEAGITAIKIEGIDEFSVYPNPLHSSGKLSVNIPVRAFVSINIYDINGKQVHSLATNQYLEPGNQTFNIDGSSLSSGTYICILKVNDMRYMRKFEVMK
ncbi:T9SS type A sorting domain-containing protein [Bacteroidota bacterium]